MEIVIDIPEEMYKEYVSVELGRGNGKNIVYNLLNAIKNGTPLPEHHGRLIDGDALKNKIMYKDDVAYETWDELYDSVLEEIDNAPTIIERSDSE